MAIRKSSPEERKAKERARWERRKKLARPPAEFVTPSQALDYLAGPKGPPLQEYATGRRGETRRDMAQACLIAAHIEGRINLIGRKGDVSNLDARSDAFERIPNDYFEHDIVLGDSLVVPPRGPAELATAEFWHDVKMTRQDFEAEFKSSSAEAALIRWWKAKMRHDGKPPTEYEAFVQFAERQRPPLPRRWLCAQLKKLPKEWRAKGTGRPPDRLRKQRAESAALEAESLGAELTPAPSARAKMRAAIRAKAQGHANTQKPARPGRIAKGAPAKKPHSDHRQIIRQEKTEKTGAGWKVNLKRRGKYMHKYFRDTKYGGSENALEAAKAYRDSLMSVASESDYMLWRRNKKPKTNTSGIVGVGRYVVKYRKGKRLQWQAAWQDADGKKHCKIFLVSTHGERQARALAIAARRDAMAELRDELTRRGAIYEQPRRVAPRSRNRMEIE